MKPEFCLQKIWDGWQSVRSPDNIKFKIKIASGESFEMFASILELVELYDTVQAKEEFDMMIGTGNIITARKGEQKLVFTIDEEYDSETTFGELERSIEQLLQDVFSQLNGGPERMPDYEQKEYPRVKEVYDIIVE